MRTLGRVLLTMAVLAGMAIAPAPAQPVQPLKLQPPILMGPGLPLQVYFDYLQVEAEVNRLLRKPCVTAAEQAAALAKAKEWITFLLKYAKNAQTKEAEKEANDYASILNSKFVQLQNKKICPPGGAGATPETPGAGSTPGNSGGSATPPPEGTNPGKQPCPDPKKVAAAKQKLADAEQALLVLSLRLDELGQELAQNKKIVSDWESSGPHGAASSMEDVEKERQVNDARRQIGENEREMKQLNDAYKKASQAHDEAINELKGYGVDPFAPCEPKDEFMMVPSATNGFNASVTPPSGGNVFAASFDDVDLASDGVANQFVSRGVCCEPGVQDLVVRIVVRRNVTPRPKPPVIAFFRSWLDWMMALGRFGAAVPAAAVSTGWRMPPDSGNELWLAPIGQSGSTANAAPVQAVITSLGASQGEAFHMQIVNDGPRPIRLSADGVVVEPLKRDARDEVQKTLQRMAPKLKNATTAKVEGYCVAYALKPPEAGMLFRVAAPSVQAQFSPARSVLRAAGMLDASGALTPDSDPKAYVESITQYAIWTKLEHWDERKYTDTWVDMTKKQIAAMKRQWTGEMETTVRRLAPGRWRDIQAIVAISEAPPVRADAGAR